MYIKLQKGPIVAHYEAPEISTLMKPCLQFSVYFDSDHNKALRLLQLIQANSKKKLRDNNKLLSCSFAQI